MHFDNVSRRSRSAGSRLSRDLRFASAAVPGDADDGMPGSAHPRPSGQGVCRRRTHWPITLLLAWSVAAGGGCGLARKTLRDSRAAGELAARSLTQPDTALKGGFETALCSYDGRNRLTVVLYDGTLDNPSQAVTIRMFWRPRAGRTPIAATATNATVNYLIFTGDTQGSVGIYSGAGFLYPKSKTGSAALSASLWQATLTLAEHDPAFQDLLGPAQLQGSFKARHDTAAVAAVLRRLNQHVRQRLGYPRQVRADRAHPSGAARGVSARPRPGSRCPPGSGSSRTSRGS